MSEQRYGPLADQYARKYGVPPKLFRLLISAESSWNPNAASGAGARGLTQVVPKWHPKANLSTPQGQLDYGAKHLGSLLKKYGNPRDALAVYNSGKPWKVSQAYGETNAYVKKILGAYASDSGGSVPADAGAVPPAVPASLPAGQLDTKALMALLNQTRDRVLQGQMPGADYQSKLMGLAKESLPRAQAVVTTKNVGAAVGQAGAQVAQTGKAVPILPGTPQWGSYGYGDPEGQGGKHLAVDWPSDNGTPARAPVSGKVVRVTPHRSSKDKPVSGQVYGGVLAIRMDDGRLVVMRHIDPSGSLRPGMRVQAGATVGTPTAWTGGDHIHFELYKPGSTDREYRPSYALNPRSLFQ